MGGKKEEREREKKKERNQLRKGREVFSMVSVSMDFERREKDWKERKGLEGEKRIGRRENKEMEKMNR